MTVYTKGTWAGGCVHTVVNNGGVQPSGPAIAAWLFSLKEDEILKALIAEVESGRMTQAKANQTFEVYTKRTHNAYRR